MEAVCDPLPATEVLAPHMTAALAALQSHAGGAAYVLAAMFSLVHEEPIQVSNL